MSSEAMAALEPVEESYGEGEASAKVELRLYVAGESPKSQQARYNLERLCETHLPARCEIEIIDLVQHPGLARADEIVAIPTLVRRAPGPVRRIIGDLSDTRRVLVGLQLLTGQV